MFRASLSSLKVKEDDEDADASRYCEALSERGSEDTAAEGSAEADEAVVVVVGLGACSVSKMLEDAASLEPDNEEKNLAAKGAEGRWVGADSRKNDRDLVCRCLSFSILIYGYN